MWREFIKEKFEEKFPVQFEGCRNQKWFFIQHDNCCVAFNEHLKAVCTFTYKNEKDYSLEISVKPRKDKKNGR